MKSFDVGEMGQTIGETGIGEMGVGETGTNPSFYCQFEILFPNTEKSMNFMYDSLLPCITGPYHIESTAKRHILDCADSVITQLFNPFLCALKKKVTYVNIHVNTRQYMYQLVYAI